MNSRTLAVNAYEALTDASVLGAHDAERAYEAEPFNLPTNDAETTEAVIGPRMVVLVVVAQPRIISFADAETLFPIAVEQVPPLELYPITTALLAVGAPEAADPMNTERKPLAT